MTIVPEANHPLGRTYEKGFVRPEDNSKKKPGTRESFGHVSSTGGRPGRISGEILWDKESKGWVVNNKSGRYSKHNSDRTPQQLANAAKLIRSVVDTGGAAWGPVLYLLEYAPEPVREGLAKSPDLAYDDPAKKTRPNVTVLAGAPNAVKAEGDVAAVAAAAPAPVAVAEAPKADKPAAAAPADPAKPKKPKAAHNDDPS